MVAQTKAQELLGGPPMTTEIANINLNEIIPGNNDRTRFDQAALMELADSIREHGLAQPITVRWLPETDCYQIVAGERRYRAVKMLGWDAIPAIIRELDDEATSAIMLAENIARADLDPIDEARAYQSRMDAFSWSVKDIAEKAGVSTVRVQFRLKLLSLRPDLQDLVRNGDLQLGYAQILSDASLDTNRQLIALGRLRDNPSPTPTWFRRVVNELLGQQAQEALFDDGLFTIQLVETKAEFIEPPHPSTTTPPTRGKSPKDILINQILFWSEAAAAWDKLGKPFKRQECETAAKALSLAVAVI